ncbi:MAG: hypothetical protein ACRYG4_14000 [Janthinobacterium lividum]
MTKAEEQALLREYLASLTRISSAFDRAITTVAALMPMDAARIDDLSMDDDTNVMVFLKRFEQFEDTLNRTLKAISKIMEHGKIERLTSVDVMRRAYHLGIIESQDIWADAVRARNTLAHEYPIDPVKRTNQVNVAWNARETLRTTWQSIQRFVENEELLA